MLVVGGRGISLHNLCAWRRDIGNKQHYIYLSDDTVAATTTFGLNTKYISQNFFVSVPPKVANPDELTINA